MIDFDKGCEECGILNENLLSTITHGKRMFLCKRCAFANDSLVIDKGEEEQEKMEEKPSKIIAKPKADFNLNDLYERARELKKQDKEKVSVFTEKEFLKDLDKEQKKDLEEVKQAVGSAENAELDVHVEPSKKFSVKDMFSFVFGSPKQKKEERSEDLSYEEMLAEMQKVENEKV